MEIHIKCYFRKIYFNGLSACEQKKYFPTKSNGNWEMAITS